MRNLLLSAVVLNLAACEPSAPQVTRGTGPTVVFEAGLGDGAEVWRDLRAALPSDVATFAWTRAGNGPGAHLLMGRTWSSDLDGRRTGREVADHLGQALVGAGQRPPYLLVAHSVGASYALAFAKGHPDQIAGIVLVDPRLPGFTARCHSEGLRGCNIPAALFALLSRSEQIELNGADETEAALKDLSDLQAVPITVLISTKPGFGEDPRWRSLWADHAAAFVEGLAKGRLVSVPSGHYIQNDAVDPVKSEILRLIRKRPV